MTTAFLITK